MLLWYAKRDKFAFFHPTSEADAMRQFHKAFAITFAFAAVLGFWFLSLLDTSSLYAQDPVPTITLIASPAGAATSTPTAPTGTAVPQPTQAAPVQAPTRDRVPIAEQFTLPLTSDTTYVVQPRDNLEQIAVAFDVQLACLRESNSLSVGEILRIGQELTISVDCPAYDGILDVASPRTDAPGRDGSDGTYVVQQNDTLDTIGQELNISVDSLKAANNIEFGRELRIGDTLIIPEDAVPYGEVPASTEEAADLEARTERAGEDSTTYVVQPGDTLDTIGQELDVSVIELLQVNNLRRGRDLTAGYTLVIPADPAPYGQYPALDAEVNADLMERMERGELRGNTVVVQPGDTLDTIAQVNNVSVEALRIANDIDSGKDLRPGRLLLIPSDVPVYGRAASLDEPAGGVIAEGDVYVLQPGDTLDHIAAGFNVDTLCLLERNEITVPKLVRAGQLIGIPADCPPYSGFDVVPDERPMTLDEMTSGSRSTTTEDMSATEEMSSEEEAASTEEVTETSTEALAEETAVPEPVTTEEAEG
jgi:LysM repeat protein